MKKKLESIIVDAVLRELDSRKGFDYFWHEIEPSIKKEIKSELREKVLRLLEKHCSPE